MSNYIISTYMPVVLVNIIIGASALIFNKYPGKERSLEKEVFHCKSKEISTGRWNWIFSNRIYLGVCWCSAYKKISIIN